MAETVSLIWGKREAEYFCARGWTGFRMQRLFCPSGKSLAVDESDDQVNRLSRLLLHDPVSRINDGFAFDIRGHAGKFAGKTEAIGMIASDGEHRHLQWADLGQQRLVVLGVLGKGRKLAAERIVDGLWPGIEFGIMLSRGLVDGRRVRRNLVVEAVEQDALAPGDEPLDVRSAEIEVPHLWIGSLRLPVAKARQWRVHDDPFGHPRTIKRSEGVADHVSDVVRDEIDVGDVEPVENACEIARLRNL